MQNSGMPHRHIVSNEAGEIIRKVEHGAVLDIGMVSDNDSVNVATQHRIVPHAGMVTQRDIPDDDGSLGEIDAAA
jgi:hypothetical protein